MIERKVNEIVESKFTCFEDAQACTQFIRGELYFYLDSLLTMPTQFDASDLPGIIDFVRLCYRLVLTWMEIFPLYNDSYRECRDSPLLFCVDLPAAISNCCYELCELFGKVFGLCNRTRNMFAAFKTKYLVQGEFALRQTTADNGLAASMTNVLGELDGFNKIIAVMKGNGDFKFPLSLAATILY